MSLRVILADDHPVVRHGLRALLELERDLSVVGEAGGGHEAVALVDRLHPNVLVVDLRMPGLGGIEVARQVAKRAPHTKIVVLSMYADESHVLEALQNGVAAYVLKDAAPAELVTAVREAAAGRRYLGKPLSERAITAYAELGAAQASDPYESLTGREREVLHLAAEGHSNAEIALRLGISPRTVEVHRANLLRKLGLRSQTDLVRYAMRRGILSIESP